MEEPRERLEPGCPTADIPILLAQGAFRLRVEMRAARH